MVLSIEKINKARELGYDDAQILESIERVDEEYGPRIKKAKSLGYDSTQIMGSIEKRLASLITDQDEIDNQEPQTPEQVEEPSLLQPSLDSTQNQVAQDPQSFSPETPETPAEKVVDVAQSMDTPKIDIPEDEYEKRIRPRDISPEELKKMSVQERMEYSKELQRHMEYQRSKGVTKGFLSGASFGLSEKIPALKPREDEHGVLVGEFAGSVLPIEGLARVIGWPLIKLVGKAPKYKKQLEAFARITSMGITGAAYEGTKEGIKKGEVPSAEELMKHGVAWAAFESVLQGLKYLPKFVNSLRRSKGNTVDKVNDVIKRVNLEETNPETLKKQIDKAITEVLPERPSMTKQQISEAKTAAQDLVKDLPKGNRKKLAERAIERDQVRTPEQLENFLKEYDTQFSEIQGKTLRDRNRKFLNKYSDKNVTERKFVQDPKGEAVEKVPKPKMSEEDKLRNAVTELRMAKQDGDKKAIKAAQKKIDIQKAKIERQKIKEQREATKAQEKVEKKEVKAFEEKVETKETKKIQKKIDSIEEQLKTNKKPASVALLKKNLAIQKKRLKEAQAASRYSVPQTPGEVNTKQKTLTAELPEDLNNPNVIEAIAEKPVETLAQGTYVPENWYTTFLKKSKKFVRDTLNLKGDPESSIYKQGWESIKRYVGEKNVAKYRSHVKWDELITKNKKISKQDRSDMIFYRERTGNPFVAGDTFEALNKRMSPEAKRVVDTYVDQHMKDTLRAMNEAVFMKQKVTPRKEVEDIYIRHMYAGKIKKANIDKAYDTIQSKFRTDNPFANKRTFLTFNDALKEAGLVPKYNDITQILSAQDAIVNRVMSNNRLVHDIRNIEKNMNTNLIVRSNQKKLYEQAKQDGWVPFEDAYLKSYVVGKGKDGKLKWAVTENPALVHPDLAPSLQGVFNKRAYSPSNAAVRMYDQVNAFLNRMHVGGSLFHYNALAESFTAKGGGILSTLRTPFWYREGRKLLENKAFMEDMIRSGVNIHLPSAAHVKQADTFYKGFLRRLQLSDNPALKKIGNLADMEGPLARMHKFLFTSWQPRMKAMQYQRNVEVMLKHFEKKGMHPNESLLKEIKEKSASAVNDQFGGQNWELIPILNDPKNRTGLQKFFAYPDWTVSAIREISEALTSNSEIRRKLGNRYIAEYLMGLGIGTQIMSYASTGLTNKPDGSITWDPKKAHSTFENEDPKKRNFFDFQMPDVYVTVAGEKINIGRDEQGRLYHMHGGKKFKEILRYFHSPVSALFSKSNPLLQLGMKLAMDYTPSEEGIFPVRGAYVEGEFRPWDGTQKWTKERAGSIAKEIGTGVLPYSGQSIISDYFDSSEGHRQALARIGFKVLLSGGAALPVSKGLSLRSSEPYWEKAFRIEDKYERQESLKALRVLLKGYGYKDRQIKSIETRMKNRVKGKVEKR